MPIDNQKVVKELRVYEESAITSLHARIDTLAAQVDRMDERVHLAIEAATSKLKAQIAFWALIAVWILQTGFLVALILDVTA